MRSAFLLTSFTLLVCLLNSCNSNVQVLKGEWIADGFVYINSISVINDDEILMKEENGNYKYKRSENEEFVNSHTLLSVEGDIIVQKRMKIINENLIHLKETWRTRNRLTRDDLYVLKRFK